MPAEESLSCGEDFGEVGTDTSVTRFASYRNSLKGFELAEGFIVVIEVKGQPATGWLLPVAGLA